MELITLAVSYSYYNKQRLLFNDSTIHAKKTFLEERWRASIQVEVVYTYIVFKFVDENHSDHFAFIFNLTDSIILINFKRVHYLTGPTYFTIFRCKKGLRC